jgi:hypothetical protein
MARMMNLTRTLTKIPRKQSEQRMVPVAVVVVQVVIAAVAARVRVGPLLPTGKP